MNGNSGQHHAGELREATRSPAVNSAAAMHRSEGVTECLRTEHDGPVGSKQTGVGTEGSFPTNSAPPISAQAFTKWDLHTFELIGTVFRVATGAAAGPLVTKVGVKARHYHGDKSPEIWAQILPKFRNDSTQRGCTLIWKLYTLGWRTEKIRTINSSSSNYSS